MRDGESQKGGKKMKIRVGSGRSKLSDLSYPLSSTSAQSLEAAQTETKKGSASFRSL